MKRLALIALAALTAVSCATARELASLNTKWPTEPRDAFIVGALVAQVAYNAHPIVNEPSAFP